MSIFSPTKINHTQVIADLLRIDDPAVNDQIWVTKDMVYKAVEASPTLKKYKKDIDWMYEPWNFAVGSDGEIHGDFVIWTLRRAFAINSGLYEQGGAAVNAEFGRIHQELEEAFSSGRLKRENKRFYLSSLARGFTLKEYLEYLGRRLEPILRILFTYDPITTTWSAATGQEDEIAVMQELTNSLATPQYATYELQWYHRRVVGLEKKITNLYRMTGWEVLALAGIGYIFLGIDAIRRRIKGIPDSQELSALLISLGLIGTCGAVVFGVSWFCCFLSERKICDYFCVAYPLSEIIKMIGIYYFVRMTGGLFRNLRFRTHEGAGVAPR